MIELFLCDCDGVLTDGAYNTSEDGSIFKSFFTRDFHGLRMLHERGILVSVITAASDGVINKQCERAAPYVSVYEGVGNKLLFATMTFVSRWSEMAFMGDDVLDTDLLNEVALAGCPADADPQIIKLVEAHPDGFVSRFSGGRGAVREFIDYIGDVSK